MNAIIPHDLQQARQNLLAGYGVHQATYAALQTEVAAAKTRLSWQPDVQGFLDALQQQEHERSVGAFERLLTALLQDVLPGTRSVVLDLYTEKGAPALDVFVRKGVGNPLEDAYSGTGGSVTNILSAGFRMIALVRSGQRPFLVLDEADCWIKPDWAPQFAAIVQQASQDLGLQVLMISHHTETLFDGIVPHRLHLEKNATGLTARWGSVAPPVWENDQRGLRSILLEHCQAHTHTLLPLSPGVTLLHGDNDIGKSAINTALRAVFYGESNDTLIQHGADFARVTVDFGPEHVLEWTRWRKGKHKVVYTLFSPAQGREAPTHQTAGAREIPTWLPGLGIGPIDGLDVQLTPQKQPVFLLNLPATHRARALAIGGETGHVQAMMALDRQEIQEARASAKNGEAGLERLRRLMHLVQPVVDGQETWNRLEQLQQQLARARARAEVTHALRQRWLQTANRLAALRHLTANSAPGAPVLRPTARATLLAGRWRRFAHVGAVLLPLAAHATPNAPERPRTPGLKSVATRWRLCNHAANALRGLQEIPAPVPPLRPSVSSRIDLAKRWQIAQARQAAVAALAAHAPEAPVLLGQNNETRRLHRRWLAAAAREAAHGAAHDRLQEETQRLDSEWAGFRVCPLCEHPLHAHKSPGDHP